MSPFYQCSAGASLTWSNPPRRQGLEAQNQWYVDQVLPHAHQSISCLGFPVNCPSTISLAHKLAGTSFLSLVNYKILVQYAKILLTRLFDCLRTRSTLAESTRQAATCGNLELTEGRSTPCSASPQQFSRTISRLQVSNLTIS